MKKNCPLPTCIISVFLLMAPFSHSLANESIKGAYKVSALVGKPVKNLQGKDLGQIEELVIATNGEVAYAVLSFGGFFGVGDKLFAVPWTALAHSPEGDHLTLDIQPKKLEKAPGFNKNDWPDMEDEKWKLLIMEFYQTPGTTSPNTKAQ